jgi:hypothetical protein
VAVAFLLGKEASFITGSSIVVDGGYSKVDYFRRRVIIPWAERTERHMPSWLHHSPSLPTADFLDADRRR